MRGDWQLTISTLTPPSLHVVCIILIADSHSLRLSLDSRVSAAPNISTMPIPSKKLDIRLKWTYSRLHQGVRRSLEGENKCQICNLQGVQRVQYGYPWNTYKILQSLVTFEADIAGRKSKDDFSILQIWHLFAARTQSETKRRPRCSNSQCVIATYCDTAPWVPSNITYPTLPKALQKKFVGIFFVKTVFACFDCIFSNEATWENLIICCNFQCPVLG